MLYLTADSPIKQTKDVNREDFCWTTRLTSNSNTAIPIFVELNGKFFLIADFLSPAEICAGIKAPGYAEALSLSITIYGPESINFAEWVNIYRCAKKNNIEFSLLPAPAAVQKNAKDFEFTVSQGALWPEPLLLYLKDKQIPWRTLYLAVRMEDKVNYITGFVQQKSPTLQSFKQFIEIVRDFSDVLSGDIFDEDVFMSVTDRRGHAHKAVDESFAALQKSVTPAAAQNRDNFESPSVSFSFTIKSAADYELALKKLAAGSDAVEAFYRTLSEYKLK